MFFVNQMQAMGPDAEVIVPRGIYKVKLGVRAETLAGLDNITNPGGYCYALLKCAALNVTAQLVLLNGAGSTIGWELPLSGRVTFSPRSSMSADVLWASLEQVGEY